MFPVQAFKLMLVCGVGERHGKYRLKPDCLGADLLYCCLADCCGIVTDDGDVKTAFPMAAAGSARQKIFPE